MTGAAWASSSGGMDPHQEDMFRKYAKRVRGRYRRSFPHGRAAVPDSAKVLTRVANWTIVLDGPGSYFLWAPYDSLDGFEFKVAVKGWLHDLFGSIFRSRDIDIEDRELQQDYSVEATDERMVKELLGTDRFRSLWSRCVHGLPPHQVIRRLEAHQDEGAHVVTIEISDHVHAVTLNAGLDMDAAVERLLALHNLLVETLRELARIGSVSSVHVEIPPLGEEWSHHGGDAR